MTVSFNDDGNDGVLRLDGKVESSLLERQEVRRFQVGAGSFREDENSGLAKCRRGTLVKASETRGMTLGVGG